MEIIILKKEKDKKCIMLIATFIFMFMHICPGIWAENVGNTSMNIPVSARVAGMGYAFTAVADDASAIDFNPAGLYKINHYFASFMHLNLGPDVMYEYINGAMDTRIGTFGASLSLIHLGEEEGVTGQSFDYFDLLSAVAYSREIFKGLSGGVTAKFLNSTIGEFTSRTVLFDAGVLYGFKFLNFYDLREPNVYLGACLKNIGSGMKYSSETETVPKVTRFGIGYKVGETLIITSDLIRQTGFPSRFGVGIENITGKFINLRLGYQGGENKKNICGGIGLLVKIASFLTTVDFAYTFENSFNNSLYTTFTFQKAPPKAEKYSLKPEKAREKEKLISSEEGKKKEELILSEEEQKPVWLKEDHFYDKPTLLFDNFEDKNIVPKFICENGRFQVVKEEENRYGKWEIIEVSDINDSMLKTSIRLPDLSKFEGIMVSLKSEGLELVELILVEKKATEEIEWRIPVSGIEIEWKNIKIPFRYFQLKGRPDAKIDLTKIFQLKFMIDKEKKGWLGIDNIRFYKE